MEQAQHFLTQYSGDWAYVFFFFLIFACGVGLPFNSDIALITAAVLASTGYFNLYILMILAFIALMSGDSCTFFAGRKWGLELVSRKPLKWLFPQRNVARAQKFLQNSGARIVFVFRFMPLIRTVLFFTSGTLKVRPAMFYAMNGLSTLIYLPLIMGISYYMSENIDKVIHKLKEFQFSLLAIAVVIFLYFVFKPKQKAKAPK